MRNNKTHLYYLLSLFFIGLISFVAFSSTQSLMADEEDNAVSSSNYDMPPPPLKTMYLSVVGILLIFCWMLRRQNRI